MTEDELKQKLEILDIKDEEKIKGVVCALIGHSNIEVVIFGYRYCARCGDQVGDNLMGWDGNRNSVVVGHNCDVCRENYKKLSWKDKFMVPDPLEGGTDDAVFEKNCRKWSRDYRGTEK